MTIKRNVRDLAESNIRDLAAKDPNFRKELLADPLGALAKLFGGKLPAGIKVHVHEESPTDIHLVLPSTAATAPPSTAAAAQPHAYCSGSAHSWASCGYELTCYGPTCSST